MKNEISNINKRVFENASAGDLTFKPLTHKENKKPFTDLDYFELLGRKAIDIENEFRNSPYQRIDYGDYDEDVIKVAKEVVKGLDSGLTRSEMSKFVSSCIKIDT